MTARSPDDLRMLVLAGASLTVSAAELSELELRYLVVTAAQCRFKPRITLRHTDVLSTDQLRRLATAGQGALHLDDLTVAASGEPMSAPTHPFAAATE